MARSDNGNWQRMQFAAEVLSVDFEPCRCNVLAKCAPPNRKELFHLREGDIRPLRFVSICIIAACGLMRLPSAQCRQVVKLSLQTIAFRGLRAEARRASIASGLPAHGRMSGDFLLGLVR